MRIAVFVKHVPDTAEADLVLSPDGRSVKTGGLPHQMNEWDRFALEEAVRFKEATGGSLTAFLLGPEEHEESLRRCLAMGADRAVRIWSGELAETNPGAAAALLAKAASSDAYDLYLSGAQSSDDGYGLVGSMVAEALNLPFAALVNKIEPSGGTLRITRELEGGFGEVLDVDLPAFLSIQTGINEPRYVSILGIKKARAKPIDLSSPADLGLSGAELSDAGKGLSVTGLSAPESSGRAEIWAGTMDEIAALFVKAVGEAGGGK